MNTDEVEDGSVDGLQRDDALGLLLRNRSQRRDLRRLPGLIHSALALLWRADARLVVISAGIQLLTAALLAAQVVVAGLALRRLLRVEDGHGLGPAALLLSVLVAVSALGSALTPLQTHLQRLLTAKSEREIWRDVLDVTTGVDLLTYETPTFYDLLHRVEKNALLQTVPLVQGLVAVVGGGIGSAVLVVVLGLIHPLLLPTLVVATVPVWFISRRASRSEFAFALAQTPSFRLREYLRDILSERHSAAEVRSFDLGPELRRRYEKLDSAFVGDLTRHVHRRSHWELLSAVVSALAALATVLLLLFLVSRGRVPLAEAGAAVIAIRLLGSRVQQVLTGASSVFEARLFLEELRQFQQIEREEKPSDGVLRPRLPLQPLKRLTVESVGFTYPGSSGRALEEVDLEIGHQEVVALVGTNGSGKTTLAKIVAGLYPAETGRLTWNEDAGTLGRSQLRDQVAVIFQEFQRYDLTAHDNIALGRPSQANDRDRVIAAARSAACHEFLDALPRGYDTLLSRTFGDGSDLSVGQWQRVALARAIFRDAPLVVLDEPTAALDPLAEHELFGQIRQVLHGRSVLLISHRFSSVRSADRIYVLDQGRVVEVGTHEQLMGMNGHYARMFTIQAAAYLGRSAMDAYS